MVALTALLAGWMAATPAATVGLPSAEAAKAFDAYVARAEMRIPREESSADTFLIGTAQTSDARKAVLSGDKVLVEQRGAAATEVPGGLIHDWIGTVFIPGASVVDVLAVVQDYDHLARYYAPEVVSSRLLARDGDDFQIALRTRDHRVITVVLDSEYQVRYGRLDAAHQFSTSRSTRVTEIADAGGAHEHAVQDAESHGYLWRLNSYWRFVEVGGGTIVQCEAISLTRNVPAGLGWLIGRYVREIPRESLETTLSATRDAVVAHVRAERSVGAEKRSTSSVE
jgi:hypothetical protein